MAWQIGVDVGGTFTDLLALDPERGMFRVAKVLSTPEDQSIGFFAGLGDHRFESPFLQRRVSRATPRLRPGLLLYRRQQRTVPVIRGLYTRSRSSSVRRTAPSRYRHLPRAPRAALRRAP